MAVSHSTLTERGDAQETKYLSHSAEYRGRNILSPQSKLSSRLFFRTEDFARQFFPSEEFMFPRKENPDKNFRVEVSVCVPPKYFFPTSPVCRKDNLPENGNKCRLCPRLPDGWLPSPHLPDGAKKDTKSAILSRRICVAVIFAKTPRSTYCCPAPPRDDANTSSHLIPSRAVRASCHISLRSH